MWSTAFDPIKFDWFYLDRLRRSSRPLQVGIMAEDRLWVKRRSPHEPNQMHNHVNVWDSLDLSNFRKKECTDAGFRLNMAAFRAIVNKPYPDDENSCMSCLKQQNIVACAANGLCATNVQCLKRMKRLPAGNLERALLTVNLVGRMSEETTAANQNQTSHKEDLFPLICT